MLNAGYFTRRAIRKRTEKARWLTITAHLVLVCILLLLCDLFRVQKLPSMSRASLTISLCLFVTLALAQESDSDISDEDRRTIMRVPLSPLTQVPLIIER